jgi:hypothetical protein
LSSTGYIIPVDPESGAAYEYHVTGELNFQVCAEFNIDSTSNGASGRYPDYAFPGVTGGNWNHGGGRVCFERVINPEVLNPVVSK